MPDGEGARVESIRLHGVRPGGLAGALGLEDGDGIRRLNGRDMTAPNEALEAYVQIRSADEVHLEIERDGESLSLHYVIVESLPTL